MEVEADLGQTAARGGGGLGAGRPHRRSLPARADACCTRARDDRLADPGEQGDDERPLELGQRDPLVAGVERSVVVEVHPAAKPVVAVSETVHAHLELLGVDGRSDPVLERSEIRGRWMPWLDHQESGAAGVEHRVALVVVTGPFDCDDSGWWRSGDRFARPSGDAFMLRTFLPFDVDAPAGGRRGRQRGGPREEGRWARLALTLGAFGRRPVRRAACPRDPTTSLTATRGVRGTRPSRETERSPGGARRPDPVGWSAAPRTAGTAPVRSWRFDRMPTAGPAARAPPAARSSRRGVP